MRRFIIEKVTQVWDNDVGERYQIGPDENALGLVRLAIVQDDGSAIQELTFDPELAVIIANALVWHATRLTEQGDDV